MWLLLFNLFGFLRFERPLVLIAIPVFLAGTYFYYRICREYDRQSIPEGLRPWIVLTRNKILTFLQGVSAVAWPVMLMVGLSGMMLFLPASTLPLHNVGWVVIFDESASMNAEEDVFGFGGRFGAAKREIIEEFAPLANEKVRPRMGLILFAGSTLRSFTLYDDYGIFLRQVASAVIPENDQGTNYEAALTDALKLCEGAKDLIYCSAVLVTDGDREAETPRLFSEIMPKFLEKKIRLDIIGVGKGEAFMPALRGYVPMDEKILKRTGEFIPEKTKYDAEFLARLAKAGRGEFYEVGERGALRKHFKTIRGVTEGEVRERTKRWTDVSDYCYMISAVLLFFWLLSRIPHKRIMRKQNLFVE